MASTNVTTNQQNNLMDGSDHDHDHVENEPSSSGISCSICLDTVSDNGGRSRAKLHCGHEFHLDCIGSAFNMKGAMQCPNCRKVEKGQWLYSNGSNRMLPEVSMDDWIPDEDFYDLTYSESPYRVHWCPFGELARLGPPFEEVESLSTTYHDVRAHHSLFSEHTAAPSVAHSYVAYVEPITPNASRSSESVEDPNLNHPWNGLSRRHEILSSHVFPAVNIQYHSWGRRSPPFSVSSTHINNVDRASAPLAFGSSTGESDTRPRSMSFPQPVLFGHGSGSSAGSSFVSSIIPRHPGSSARTHERNQISHVFPHQQPSNSPGIPTAPMFHGIRRFDGPRALPTVVPTPAQHDHASGFLFIPPAPSSQNPQEAENALPNHFHAWDRDHLLHFPHVPFDSNQQWGSFHQNTGAVPNPGNRSGSFWHRHSS